MSTVKPLHTRLTLDRCIATHQKLGFPVFERGDYNINFAAYRSINRTSDIFDDAFVLWFKVKGVWTFYAFPGTVDPGSYWLTNAFSSEAAARGTAIVVPGFYPKLWTPSVFKGRRCLTQATTIKIYGDNNRNTTLDLGNNLQTGYFGILYHPHFQNRGQALRVFNSSAGCQVPQNDADFEWSMDTFATGVRMYGPTISYALIHEEQLV